VPKFPTFTVKNTRCGFIDGDGFGRILTRSILDHYNVVNVTDLRRAAAGSLREMGEKWGKSCSYEMQPRALRMANCVENQCRGRDLNPDGARAPGDFKSPVSADFTTPASSNAPPRAGCRQKGGGENRTHE
jgi:hypothetical protein